MAVVVSVVMFVCSTQVRRETLGLIGVCFSKVWLSFYSCGLPLNGSASPFTTKIGGNIQAAQISPRYVAVEPCYVAPWPDCVGGFVWVGRIFFFLEGGVGAPPPPLPHLPSLHHPKIWIFFFFFQIPWMYKVLDYFFSLFLVYFKFLIDLKKKEKFVFLLQVLFFLQVLSLFLYLITFFVASST